MDNLKNGGSPDSVSALALLPSLRDDTSTEPRMLTPSEIDWLKRHNRAVGEWMTANYDQVAVA